MLASTGFLRLGVSEVRTREDEATAVRMRLRLCVCRHFSVGRCSKFGPVGTRLPTKSSRNLLAQMFICAAELATWGVGPDVKV